MDSTHRDALSVNPFVVETPEKLAPKQIVDLFVDKFTKIETLKQRKHTFTWGSRGSGKSMMARYLEPRCQELKAGSHEAFLQQSEPFLAVYCPCKEGHLNRSELSLIGEGSALIISEHLLNILVADRLVHCLLEQFPKEFIPVEHLAKFTQSAIRLFGRASIATSVEIANGQSDRASEPLMWIKAVLEAEARSVSRFLRAAALQQEGLSYTGATSGYHDFLLPFLRLVKTIPKFEAVTVFVLLDDADRLTTAQQSIVNEWIANRDHSVLCVKVSARREYYRTMRTRSGTLLEQPHDYSEVDVDELYTNSKTDYWEKLRLIANRRLELSKISSDIERFLPADEREAQLFSEIREKTAAEWDAMEKKAGDRSDYIHRYSTPRLFQYLRSTKKRKSYAGFDNVVDLSSGIIRDFLEPCYLMFDHVVSQGSSPQSIQSIPTAIQDQILYHYSEEFLLAKFEDLRKEVVPEEWDKLDRLRCLVESIGRFFYERLHDPNSREARLFSFTIRGEVPAPVQEVLRLGVRYRYFQVRTYSRKEGGGREPWYILNRRLCPVFKLDASGFEGRASLTPEMLLLACTDSDRFVRLRTKQDSNEELSLFPETERGDGT